MPIQMPRFQRGVFVDLTATRSFTLGKTGVTVSRGTTLGFDGATVDYGGNQYAAPEAMGAIKAGWLVLEGDYDETAAPERVSANIQVRHATQGGNPMQPGQQQKVAISTTEQDEREVGSVKAHAETARNRNVNRGRTATAQVGGAVEMQDGVPVRTLKTAAGEKAKQTRTTLTAGSAGEVVRQANTSGVIEPGQGVTEDEFLDRMPPEERDEYLAKKAAKKAAYVDAPLTPAPVARVARQTAPVDLAPLAAPEVTTRTVDGITLTNTNGPKRDGLQPSARAEQRPAVVVRPAGEDVRRRIAKAMCADFPDLYDFTQPIKKKIARLHADFDDRPDVLRAVFAAEADDVKALLVEEFPDVFAT